MTKHSYKITSGYETTYSGFAADYYHVDGAGRLNLLKEDPTNRTLDRCVLTVAPGCWSSIEEIS